MFALFLEFGARTRSQDLWPFLISETGLKFLIWTQGEIQPGNRASPVNQAHVKLHVKRPWWNGLQENRLLPARACSDYSLPFLQDPSSS